MLLTLLQFFATKFLVLALHLEAGSFPKPLSAREEIETFAALRAGDRSAREKIIRHNLRLVAHVAKKYYAQPGDQEDLISIGTIGLMKAVDTFDTTRKARFATYASRCIENAILSRMRLWFQTSIPRAEKNRDGVFWHRYPRICISFALLWTAA
ncbi:sigma-70 family RNA polymerase sigma factor [Faecalibacterium duncaniae]|jgi:RNA polymerase sigma factor, sigma-70 family|uniref:sigma-70 family RNA polymerase sigma factor n=2 Tax=Faecalibacterium duncaniae (strain DSM 17677 / JCM 31915 / A2-165) TaxID=411483 RepID=UPI00209C92B7|nr:sigma-70 family RNA polymerase sigma factor [Faecalibacterium duncaniae]UTB39506.1 sigma-70 family RNA polymerase sigma factor [Faecalibacterium duncaniae]